MGEGESQVLSKHKHLEFIQSVIARLAGNSFAVKRWTVLLVSAFLALAIREPGWEIVGLAALPVLVFWGLDGYFLWQERLYRSLYDSVRQVRETEVDFSMDVSALSAAERNTRWWRSTLSRTLAPFYGMLLVSIALISYLLAVWR